MKATCDPETDTTEGDLPDRDLAHSGFDASLLRMTLRARVHNGRLVVDEPTDLPDGTEVELFPLDPGDWLDDEDRAMLHRALAASDVDVEAGRVVDASSILSELRSV